MPDAIREDVSGASANGGIPDLNDPNNRMSRSEAMRAMALRRHQTAADDMDPKDREGFLAAVAEPAAAPAAAADEDVESNAAEEARRQLEAQAAASTQLAAESDRAALTETAQDLSLNRAPASPEPTVLDGDALGRTLVKIKVNGVERTVTVEEAIRTAQKIEAGDAYLEQAKQIVREVRTVADQVQARSAAASAPAATSPDDQGDTTPGADPIDEAIGALFQGDEAKAKEALRRATQARTPAGPAVDPNALASQIEQSIVIRSALKQFAKDHRDIAEDPVARQVADQFLAVELQQRGATRLEQLNSDAIPEVFEAAGRRTKDWFREKAGVPKQTTAATIAGMDERRNAKQGIDELPAASTRSQSHVPPPLTNSDRIAAMKRARGQIGSA